MMLETNQALTGDEIEAIFRQELEAELTRNLHDAYENAPWSSSVGEAALALPEAFRIFRRPNRPCEPTDTNRTHPDWAFVILDTAYVLQAAIAAARLLPEIPRENP